ncbi:MAG: hypothetical protein FD130_1563, partial [Halothiobacillaceae bacterium]
ASNKVHGILPLVELKSFLFGHYAVSLPFFNYGGLLASSETAQQALLLAASELSKRLSLRHLELRHTTPIKTAMPCRTDKVLMQLALPESVELLWRQLGPKMRAQIKRADRENIVIKEGGAELVASFYAVFAQNMRDLGTPVYTKKLFEWIVQAFPDESRIIVIEQGDKPIAAAFLLGDKRGRLEIPWASSLKEYNRMSVNMRLYWEVLQYAIAHRYPLFDFGRSTMDSGTYRFKKQWGASPVQCYWYYGLKEGGELPQLNPDNPKFRLAIRLWQRLPLAWTKILGPVIVKSLP